MRDGKVYIIGAGPGNPGLITVRGLECLRKCDIVVYDQLTPLILLTELDPDVELIDVGKEAGKHTLKQEDINQLLVDRAGEGKIVGRFKGGDPFVFGRGGEEALYLKENNIEYEIIPGVTAGIAASAYAGIPVTHRKMVTQTVFVTAHEAEGKESVQMDWEQLAKMQAVSIVGYMGVKTLPDITSKLIEYGMSPTTPAAVIHRGTTPSQRTVTGTLDDIAEIAKKNYIKPPAIFIIGDTVDLKEKIEWCENKPLFGKRIVVTRASDQVSGFINELYELGAHVLPFPTIATENNIDDNNIKKVISNAANYDWLIFTSENGVRYFMNALINNNCDIRRFNKAQIAVVGEGTSRALSGFYIKPDYIPEHFLTRRLAEELISKFDIKSKKILRVRGEPAPSTVEDMLRDSGAEVNVLIAYNTVVGKPLRRIKDDLIENGADLITFTSSSTVRNFVAILGDDAARKIAENATVLSIGPMTSQRLKELNLPVEREASIHSIPGMLEEIINWNK
ncbi:MAG: uroporphyrinogen-III C-methyltransferase [candidate division Zixibacteria bacterium]|nr:uroporphyrinogen-III C-methyltransferase [candidate division Zixibacteria bacterium]